MKSKYVILCCVILVFLGSNICFAQSSNNEQRIIGTWVDVSDDTTAVFNSNGTVNWFGTNLKYGVAGNRLALITSGGRTIVYDITFSNNGRTLIIHNFNSVDSQSSNGIFLTRKS